VCAVGARYACGRRKTAIAVDRVGLLRVEAEPPADIADLMRQVTPRCTYGFVNPVLKRNVGPRYTPEALRARIEGTVFLAGIVRPDGSVDSIRVMTSVDATQGLR
jgi:hypothetical protein